MRVEDLNNLIGRGAQADVYRIGDKAVKVFREDYQKKSVFYEAMLHSIIEGTKLPVPKIYEVIQFDNRMAIVMDMIEGTSFKDVILNDFINLELHMNLFIDLQMQVHSIHTKGLPNMKDKLIGRISSSNILSYEQKSRLLFLLDSFETGSSLCHGDFHFSNIIRSNGELKIIDWIDAVSGNPEADVCRTYMLYRIYFKEYADMYLNQYCRKSNKGWEEIIKWMPVIAAARLSEGNESEKSKLLEWVDRISE